MNRLFLLGISAPLALTCAVLFVTVSPANAQTTLSTATKALSSKKQTTTKQQTAPAQAKQQQSQSNGNKASNSGTKNATTSTANAPKAAPAAGSNASVPRPAATASNAPVKATTNAATPANGASSAGNSSQPWWSSNSTTNPTSTKPTAAPTNALTSTANSSQPWWSQNSTTNPTGKGSTANTAPGQALTQRSGASGGNAAAADNRGAIPVQGLGAFRSGPSTLTAYGCYRSGTRVFCDFDYTSQQNQQLDSSRVFRDVQLVDQGGRITGRNNGFYLDTTDTPMTNAYVTQQPVRYIMEFDNVSPQVNSLSVVWGPNQIQSVPVSAIDSNSNQFPSRSNQGTTTQQQGTPQPHP